MRGSTTTAVQRILLTFFSSHEPEPHPLYAEDALQPAGRRKKTKTRDR